MISFRSYTSSLLCSHSGISRRTLSSQPKSRLADECKPSVFEYVCVRVGFDKRKLTRQCKMYLPHVGQLDHQYISRRLSPKDQRSSPSRMICGEQLVWVWVNQEKSSWNPESVRPPGRGRGHNTAFRSPVPGGGPLCETHIKRNVNAHRGEVMRNNSHPSVPRLYAL